MTRRCSATKDDGQPCQMAPLIDRQFCFSHDPERSAGAAEARRLGGQRRRRERTVSLAYDLPGIDTAVGIRRLLNIVVADGLGLPAGVQKLRVLISVAGSATKLLETGELEDRIAALEAIAARDDR